VENQTQLESALEPQLRVQCDSCSARAMVLVELPYGELAFCYHHYNNHAVALTEQGGVARLLGMSKEEVASV
jgi:hypothetical protein